MSVVLTPSSFEYPHPSTNPKCVFCNGRPHPPFIVWRSENLVCICGDCAESFDKGLMADLIQVKAIKDLHRLYPTYTLEREEWTRLRDRQQREKDAPIVQRWKLS